MSNETERLSGDILLEFLEIAIHTVVYSRRLYPDTIFVKKKLYGTPVYCSIHPEVNSYITESLKGIQELIKKNEVKKVCVVFCDKNTLPIDKIVFDVLALYSRLVVGDSYFIHTEESLRAALLKISHTCRTLKELPEDASFLIQVHTTETASLTLTDDPNNQEDFPWIEAERKCTDIVDGEIVPVREIDTDYLHLEVYALQTAKKSTN
ncbi:hypothetical protein R5R35_006321 [Gryllus longicercus]|uniref:HORMA domain-containing protein n=1 Tax=Gryllus longicercus TaxID=2509291 RepID=A0AAN9VG20_9ORTH